MSSISLWNELSYREQLISLIWDAYKDAYGTRPRDIDFSTMSEQDLEKQLGEIAEAIDS